MTLAEKIKAYRAANPEAKEKDIAKELGTSTPYVYQVLNDYRKQRKLRVAARKAEAAARKAEADARKAEASKAMPEPRKNPMFDALYAQMLEERRISKEREDKLMGVIEYLESKLNGTSV